MCGILGVVQSEPVSLDWLRSGLEVLRHRGPDGEGELVEGGVGLGMRRLSIIDIATGWQPMHSPDGTLSIVFNGEIYNYRAIRDELKEAFDFRTTSDTEVVLAAYAVWGEAAFSRLNGMYAIALLDRRRSAVILARDPMGIKPLYWWADGHRVVFGSELKLFTRWGLARRVSRAALAQFLTSGYVFHPETALEEVRQLEPGMLMCIALDGTRKCSSIASWRTRPAPKTSNPDTDSGTGVLAALDDAVERQMVADVPVGLLLSSGLDSMLVLSALHQRQLTEGLETFTVTFDEPTFSEHQFVERAASEWGFRNTQLRLSGEDVAQCLDRVCYACDNLELLPTALAIYFASHLASGERKVVLAGNGGDELFAGYPTYTATRALARMQPARFLFKPARALARRFHQGGYEYLSWGERISRFLEGAPDPPALAHLRWRHIFLPEELTALLMPDWQAGCPEEILLPQFRYFKRAESLGWKKLDALIYADLSSWLVDCGLSMWDKTGMSASLEIRVPLLDLEFVDTVLSVPARQRAYPVGTKRFLRQAAHDRLPESVRNMPKHGFQVPLARWLRGPLRRPIEDASRALPSEVFRRDAIAALWKEFDAGRTQLALPLWLLGALGRWAAAMEVSW
jgi:asparagine synthase (glutamine-hydrolysing)